MSLVPVLQNHWRSSLTQAVFAELIAEKVKGADPATYFLAAMLQDIGILAMISEAPLEYLENVLSRSEFPNVAAAERAHFGFSHVDVSVELLNHWGLGTNFGADVKHHHDRIAPAHSRQSKSLLVALQAASLGTAVLFSTRSSARSLDSSLDQWIGFLKIHFDFSKLQIEEMISEVNQRIAEYSSLFKFQIGENIQSEEVVTEAKELLQEIALKNQLELIFKNNSGSGKSKENDPMYRDSLSGLYNRRYLNEHLNDQLARCIKRQRPIAFLFLDVDKFKGINDKFGHAAGDQAIRHVAGWLNNAIRKDDLAIRLGGDEFLVVLQNVSEHDFEIVAARFAAVVSPMELSSGKVVKISLSVGCTFYQPEHGDSADANWLIDQADQSMYRAKKGGGAAVSVQKFVGTSLIGV